MRKTCFALKSSNILLNISNTSRKMHSIRDLEYLFICFYIFFCSCKIVLTNKVFISFFSIFLRLERTHPSLNQKAMGGHSHIIVKIRLSSQKNQFNKK